MSARWSKLGQDDERAAFRCFHCDWVDVVFGALQPPTAAMRRFFAGTRAALIVLVTLCAALAPLSLDVAAQPAAAPPLVMSGFVDHCGGDVFVWIEVYDLNPKTMAERSLFFRDAAARDAAPFAVIEYDDVGAATLTIRGRVIVGKSLIVSEFPRPCALLRFARPETT